MNPENQTQQQPVNQPTPTEPIVNQPAQPQFAQVVPPKKSKALKIILIVIGVIVGLFFLMALLGFILDAAGYKKETATTTPATTQTTAASKDFTKAEIGDLKAAGNQILAPISAGDYSTAYAHASDTFKAAVPTSKLPQAFAYEKMYLDPAKDMPVYVLKTHSSANIDQVEYTIVYPATKGGAGTSYVGIVLRSDRKTFDTIFPSVLDQPLDAALADMKKVQIAAFKANYPTVTGEPVTVSASLK